jgi:hypothetical protein
MKQENKLSAAQHSERAAELRPAASGSLEFQNAEDLLRHDAARTVVPPQIARRLGQSIAQSPPRRPWWRRLLG